MRFSLIARLNRVSERLNAWSSKRYGQIAKIRMPKMIFPKMRPLRTRVPQITLPRLTLPRLKKPQLPKVTFPKIVLPKISLPQIKAPKITLPKVKTPNLPSFKMPHVALPKLNYSLSTRHILSGVLIFVCMYVLVASRVDVIASGASTFNFSKGNNGVLTTQNALSNDLNSITPAAGEDFENTEDHGGRYPIEESTLEAEAVLIPRETTVISSSRDSKIKAVYFDNGETFKKGDVLVEYVCKDARAEVEIAEIQQNLTQKKSATSYKLFKLDIISDLEKQELETENKQAAARADLYKSRMDECFIRAEYDGRVVKRLANAGEFTRTDRVLMEVASLGYLKADFLMPSRWLRWVNVGANIEISINETGATYEAEIKHIYGEVDPVSQSVQITAQLSPYEDVLLPGMSGSAKIDINAIRADGIYGFLERNPNSKEQ